MKKLTTYLWLLISLTTLFSCSQDEVKIDNLDEEKAILSFGSLLNDLSGNRAMQKEHLDDLPECTDGIPAYVEVALSQGGSWVVGSDTDPLRVELSPDAADFDGDGLDNYFTKYSSDLELVPGTYTLEYFSVFDATGTQLWIAPRSGLFENMVGSVLPMDIPLGAGVKKYVSVDVVCYDRRMVNEYGYLFFDINQSEIINFCIFGNLCDENGRHSLAEYVVDVWYGTDDSGQLLYADLGNTIEVNNDGDESSEPVCLALPDKEGEDNYYIEISMNGVVVRSGIITDTDVKDLYTGDNNVDYFHFFEGNCNSIDSPDLFNEGDGEQNTSEFTVTITNVVIPKPIFQSGVFSIPEGETAKGPLFPGDAYEFEINAGPVVLPMDGGTRLSFVTMFVQSNDLFFAPDEGGIPLYDGSDNPIGSSGPVDVTDQVFIWDSGTEVNEATGGPNQKPQQAPTAEDQGIDENGVVTKIIGNTDSFGNIIPDADEVIKVTIEYIGDAQFRVRIINVSTATTIATPALGEGTRAAVPISPGVYAVHTKLAPFFKVGEPAANAGLVSSQEGVENIAEDGFPAALAADTFAATGLIVPLSPGAWAVHEEGTMHIYALGVPVFGNGLEAVAEDGTSMALANYLSTLATVSASAAFNTPVGASSPGPIGPGQSYKFSFTASEGMNLSLATMFIQSNDWFYSFDETGIPLFNNGVAIDGNITSQVFLYDAGTEIDEYPGAGLFQVIRQPAPNTGAPDPNNLVRLVGDSEFNNVPPTSQVIMITIESN
ncbi:spondin domain-containing protein [Gillisia sp. JM1]|uniref:spondin domain-containing protein n=1 Tax=Gillisia sp. JM1 TaxID=1283286 RepID=UPI00040A3F19|nr:spondin domain-containing protein [Gillisia sp. JM1]